MSTSRKTLQTLQPLANNERLLVGGDGTVRLDPPSSDHPKKNMNENSDPKITAKIIREANKRNNVKSTSRGKSQLLKVADKSTGTDDLAPKNVNKSTDDQDIDVSSRDVLQWMTQTEPPENYWRMLAEQRRIALEETLKENEKLHRQNETLREENVSLGEINEILQEMAAQGERLAEMLQGSTDN